MYVIQFETLIKSKLDFCMCLNSIEIYVCRSIQNNTLCSITRPLALRRIYWEISCDAHTNFKKEYEDEMNTEIFGVHQYQIAD